MEEKLIRPDRPPGVAIPWDDIRAEIGPIQGDEELVKRVWQETDSLAYMYIWQLVMSF